MTTPCNCDPVGVVEILERMGVTRGSFDTWRNRGQFPEPRWTVGGRPAWNWPDIADWLPPRRRNQPG